MGNKVRVKRGGNYDIVRMKAKFGREKKNRSVRVEGEKTENEIRSRRG